MTSDWVVPGTGAGWEEGPRWGELELPGTGVVTGTEVVPGTGTFGGTEGTETTGEEDPGVETGWGTHLVQTVDVLVSVIVETVVVTWVVVMLPVVIVLVTGQVVRVVWTTSVVYTGTVVPGTEGEETAVVGELPVEVAGVGVLSGVEGVLTG